MPPSASQRSACHRNGIHHCENLLWNAAKRRWPLLVLLRETAEMHEGFVEEGTPDDIDCPFCDSQMKVRSFAFQRLDGSLQTRSKSTAAQVVAHFGWMPMNFIASLHLLMGVRTPKLSKCTGSSLGNLPAITSCFRVVFTGNPCTVWQQIPTLVCPLQNLFSEPERVVSILHLLLLRQ